MFLRGGSWFCDHKFKNNCECEEARQERAENNDKVFKGAKIFQISMELQYLDTFKNLQ